MSAPCRDCLKACILHGLTYCGTCHTHAGECDMGGCEAPAVMTFVRRRGGKVVESRAFCMACATAPHFACVRAGMEAVG